MDTSHPTQGWLGKDSNAKTLSIQECEGWIDGRMDHHYKVQLNIWQKTALCKGDQRFDLTPFHNHLFHDVEKQDVEKQELTVLPYLAKMVSLPQEEVRSFAAAAGQTYPAKPYQI